MPAGGCGGAVVPNWGQILGGLGVAGVVVGIGLLCVLWDWFLNRKD